MNDATPSLEARIARLEAIRDIEELKHRYLRAVDARNFDEFRECFVTEGASLGYGPMGHFNSVDELLQVFNAYFLSKDDDGNHIVYDMHHAVHPDIEIISDTEATGRWTLRFREVNTRDRVEVINCGTYTDRYVKVDGRWRIQEQEFSILWMFSQPLSDDATVIPYGFDS
ncbi:nuclear transport factor 2 family protein [Enemella sp. A6]|uniref:nuclear transport factor 2 family protein n=1 Tax=Enemella sp. A6 TaxID=3440152 RepID=UPI003EBE9BEB